jgi:long-chain acyl-CoA synthetase
LLATAKPEQRIRPFPVHAETLPALFTETIERNSSRIAMKSHTPSGDRTITFGEFGTLIERLGAALIARGLERGDRVALLAENSPDWCLVYGATTSAGGVIVPLDTQLKRNDVHYLLRHCEARFLFVSPGFYDEMIGGPEPSGIQVTVIGEDPEPRGTPSLARLIAEGTEIVASGGAAFAKRRGSVEAEDMAAIVYTSGTTGRPKGVVLLQRNIASNAEACRMRLPFVAGDVFLSILPLYHTYATTCNFLSPLAAGARIVFGRSLKSRDVQGDIENEAVTVICAVPLLFDRMAKTMATRLAERPAPERFLFRASKPVIETIGRVFRRNVARQLFRGRLEKSGFGSIRFFVSGAAALKGEVESALFAVGLPILQGYGMTEASPVIAVNPLDAPRRGTVGPALPGIEVRIAEPDEDGVGEIIAKGPNIMSGYFKDPEETAKILIDGWLHTGDLGSMDSKGYITFVGRKKSVIVTGGGKNVYPDELEALLNDSSCILESVVLAARDRKGNEEVAAIVVPDYEALAEHQRSAGSLTDDAVASIIASEIRSICSRLPEYKRIREFRIRREELPKTSTRKVQRHLVAWPRE